MIIFEMFLCELVIWVFCCRFNGKVVFSCFGVIKICLLVICMLFSVFFCMMVILFMFVCDS